MGLFFMQLFVVLFMGEAEQVEVSTPSEPIEIIVAGDAMMDWSVKETIAKKGVDYPFLQVRKEIAKSDYALVNLETAVTKRTEKYPKMYNFKSNPEALQGLKNAGFDMVSLANNHSMDYRVDGLFDTMTYLDEFDLNYIGAGRDSSEAFEAKSVFLKGKHVKFLGVSRVLPDLSWFAGADKPGIAGAYDLDKVLQVIRREKRDCDYLLVFIHWGKERRNMPETYQKVYAKEMVDAGADIIVGSHPHVLQGFAYMQGKPIAYSLGNFLFPDYVRGKTAQTGLLKLIVAENEISMAFKPMKIEDDQIVPISPADEEKTFAYLEEISSNILFQEGFIHTQEKAVAQD